MDKIKTGIFYLLFATLLVSGCSRAEDEQPDKDAKVSAVCPPIRPIEGATRARLLECEADLPKGKLAGARVGDVVLENHLARFVVRTAAEGKAISGLTGGNVVDAVRIGPDGEQIGEDSLLEWVSTVAIHLVKPTSVEVTGDGSDGPAEVTVKGTLVPFPTLYAYLPIDTPALTVEHRYRLLPNATTLEARTEIRSTDGKDQTVFAGDVMLWGGDLSLFRPGGGTESSGVKPPSKGQRFGFVPERGQNTHIAQAVAYPSSMSVLETGGILGFIQPAFPVPADGATFVRYLSAGGRDGPDLANAMADVTAQIGGQTQTYSGTVTGTELYAGQLRVVLLNQKGGPLTRCAVDDEGGFRCPGDATVNGAQVLWLGNGAGQTGGGRQRGEAQPFGDDRTVALQGPAAARLKLDLRSADDEAIPVQVVLIPADGAASKRHYVDLDGQAEFTIPPGDWTVWVTHGPEWSALEQKVNLKPGGQQTVKGKLERVLSSEHWVAADTHIHAEHSVDSVVPNRERILDAVAAGVDYAVATDHDIVTDYRPWVKEVGAEGMLTVASGVEVSTAKYGHHGVWPIANAPERAGNGAPSWQGQEASKLIKVMRGDDPARVLQMNHPRGSQSYFLGIEFDPATTSLELLKFDAIEVLNSKRIGDTEEVLADWIGILKRGVRMAVVGTSDTHGLSASCGSARTWVYLPPKGANARRDQQGAFTGPEVDDAIRAGRTVASTGPLLTPTLMSAEATATVGETLTSEGQEVRFSVTVAAPAWMPLGTLSVIRGGEVVKQVDLSETPAVNGQKKATVEVKGASAATWWVAVLRPNDNQSRPPIQARPVWAVSSAIFQKP